LKAKGCYAKQGPLFWTWNKLVNGQDIDAFCDHIAALPDGQLWRHNQAGDLPGIDNAIDAQALRKITAANIGKRGFTYTHKPLTQANLEAITCANADGFTVNISADSPEQAAAVFRATGLPTVCILPSDSKAKSYSVANILIVTCPASLRDTTCNDCRMCADPSRNFVIGFPAHGVAKKHVDSIVGTIPQASVPKLP
jgi:hypothetical protein